MKTKNLRVYDLCLISIFAAVISIMAQIAIPMPYLVPMTMQTLAIALTGILLGPKKGTISTFLYVLIGAAGAPVFAGFNGGIGAVLGPTGGFIMSFPFLAFAAGFGAAKNSTLWLWGGLFTGVIVNYFCGVVYFSLYTSNDLITSFTACVLLFIPTDIIKMLIAGLLGRKVRLMILHRYVV